MLSPDSGSIASRSLVFQPQLLDSMPQEERFDLTISTCGKMVLPNAWIPAFAGCSDAGRTAEFF